MTFIADGVALLLRHWKVALMGALVLALSVQTLRVSNLKADVRREKAAQINPVSKKLWRDEAIRDARDLRTCRQSNAALEASRQAQNAAVAAWKAEGDQRLAAAEKGLQQALRGRQRAEAQARDLMRPPVGIDACARMEDIDARVLENLR